MNATENFYIISYDLKRPHQDYPKLYETIKSFLSWQHPLESTWVVYTRYNANEISNRLRNEGEMDDNDLLLVCRLEIQDRQGWLDKTFWEWIKSMLSA